MPTVTQVNDLKINKLTKAQYDAAVQAGTIGENEISIITDLDATPQVDSLPTADASQVGKIYQYIGVTDANYTNGYFYKCVSDGQSPATYSWERVDVQPAPVIPDPLPSQSGNAGKFLTTDGTDASWSDKPLINKTTASFGIAIDPQAINVPSAGNYGVSIGTSSRARELGVSIGNSAGWFSNTNAKYAICIGYNPTVNAIGGYQFGYGTNNEAGTVCFALNTDGNNAHFTNYKLLDSDGTIPEARLADTTSATQGQALVLDSNLNATWSTVESLPSQTGNAGKVLTTNGTIASWVDIASTPASTPMLQGTSTYWIEDPNTHIISQIINVQGVTATNVVMVSPTPVSADDYAQSGVICTAQGAGTLTFTCKTIPSVDLTLNVVCF